jgi:hypothetical protein
VWAVSLIQIKNGAVTIKTGQSERTFTSGLYGSFLPPFSFVEYHGRFEMMEMSTLSSPIVDPSLPAEPIVFPIESFERFSSLENASARSKALIEIKKTTAQEIGRGPKMSEASDFLSLLVNFSPMFTSPSFNNFVTLACGWVLCVGRRPIPRVIQFGSVGKEQQHHSIFYYFFSRARWIPDALGKFLFQMALKQIPESLPLCLTVDDTLSRRSGPQLFGGSMHHDPLLSNYGRGKTLVKFFSFGHSWVIICVVIPLPWNKARFMAIPVAFRLCRGKEHCPPKQNIPGPQPHKERGALAVYRTVPAVRAHDIWAGGAVVSGQRMC